MSDQQSLEGECLCGAVKWQAVGPFDFFGLCQCSLCRKVTGSAFASNLFVGEGGFTWVEGADHRLIYHMPKPKKFGTASCKTCGSRVPKESGAGRMLIPLGSTSAAPGIAPTLVCADDHTNWFCDIAGALPE